MSIQIPTPKYEFKHIMPIQMRFNDIDMLGHVNNAVYMEYFDLAKVDYFTQFTQGTFDPRKTGMVVASIHCDYYMPVLPGDKISVATAVDSMGTSSLRLEQRIIDQKGNTKCIATTTMVNIDPATLRSTPITDKWRSDISEFEGRNL